MAKKNNVAQATDTQPAEVSTPKPVVPEGFEETTSDVVAVYDYKMTDELFVRPLGYTVSDSKDKKKPSILVHCELLKAALLFPMGDDAGEEPVVFEAGARIGIWYRPGLRNLMQCHKCTTHVAFTGEKDVGQILPMKTFSVARKKGSTPDAVPMIQDYRKQTRHMTLPWEDASAVKQSSTKGSTQPLPNDDDDVPF